MFQLSADWWEIIIRVLFVYAGVLILVRLSGKRQLAELAPMDLLTLLLVSETVSPALTGDDSSLTAGAIAAATLFALSFILALLTYRFRRFERLSEGTPRVLISDGVVNERVMAAERMTAQELGTALRMNGVARMEDIMLAMVEPSGAISFVKRPG